MLVDTTILFSDFMMASDHINDAIRTTWPNHDRKVFVEAVVAIIEKKNSALDLLNIA